MQLAFIKMPVRLRMSIDKCAGDHFISPHGLEISPLFFRYLLSPGNRTRRQTKPRQIPEPWRVKLSRLSAQNASFLPCLACPLQPVKRNVIIKILDNIEIYQFCCPE